MIIRLARLLPLFVVLLIVSCFSAQAEGPVDGPKASSGQAQDGTGDRVANPGRGSQRSFKVEPTSLSLTESGLAPVPATQTALALPKFEDFEGTWPNDWLLYGDPTWGPEDCNWWSSNHSGWSAAWGPSAIEGCVNPYPADQSAWMVYGPFDLSAATSAGVDFYFDMLIEFGYDFFAVGASTDGNGFDGYVYTGDNGGWRNDSFDLGPWLGQPQVWVAFALFSDSIIGDWGAFVDDVNIWADTGPPPEGCWTGLPPAAAAADVPALEPSSEEGEGIAVREARPPTAADQAVPGELIVKFAPSVSRSGRDAVVRQEGAALMRHLLVPGYALVRVPPGKEEQFLARLEANPNVEMAERNGVMQATFVPNDMYYSYQWHMPQIQMEQAWDVASGSGVVVAVIDTGVAYEDYAGFAQAPDLAGTAFTPGCDFVNNDYHPNDDDGHGTHVTGTVAQTTNNTIGVAGVAYGATIMPIKVLDNAGSGTDADVADGITWAADYGADVINLSLGGGYSSVVETAINYALSNGVVVVAATGNDDAPSLSCPACYPGVIAVGATDYNRNRAPYSNYGCGVSGHCLDVVAPGGDVRLGVDENHDGYPDGVLQQTFEFVCQSPPATPDFTRFVYCFFQGTSMASPHVAGAAALLLDANPGLTVQQVGDCLRNTALDRGDSGYDLEYGYGLIQVRDALNACGPIVDSDDDGVPDESDKCPETYDTGNGDNDGDGIPGTQPPPGATWGGDACDADDDNDLMLDTYEDAYACLDPLLADGEENADGDELRNYPEMVVATDPCVANPELADDSDGDGGSDGRERYIGTDPLDDCTNDGSPEERGTHDAWHFDINIDTWSDILDVLLYKGHLQIQYSEPGYDSRLDFNADGWVDILDILLYKGDLQIQCTNP